MAAKGYDDSPPRNGLILFYTISTLVFLLLVKVTLDSYFADVMGAEVHDKVLSRGMEPVKAMRAREEKLLRQGSMPIEQAARAMSQRGRAASPMITPKSGMGEDGQGMEEVRGWTTLGRKVAPMPSPEPSALVDAGAAPVEEAPAPRPKRGARR